MQQMIAAATHWTVVLKISVLMSLFSIFLYWTDKQAAMRGGWRTPEKVLHSFALLGGWPGALLAQRLFRHKTRKAEFQLVFWLTVVMNVAGVYWLFFGDPL